MAEKSKIKELANSLSAEGHLPSLQTAASHLAIYLSICIYILPCREGESKSSLVSSYKGANLIMEALPFINSSKPIYLPQAPSPKTIVEEMLEKSVWDQE